MLNIHNRFSLSYVITLICIFELLEGAALAVLELDLLKLINAE